MVLLTNVSITLAQEQDSPPDDPSSSTAPTEPALEAPTVNVEEVVDDEDIESRLLRILNATDWFTNPTIRVDEGVAFLNGKTQTEQHRSWAATLAGKTEDVVAVVNRIEVIDPPVWNIDPAISASRDLGRSIVQSIPMLVIAVVIAVLTGLLSRVTVRVADKTVLTRVKSTLLREVARKALLVPVWLIGIYLVLRISGLTRLAMTVVGGTGVLGLVAGFAFRDIAENFLSSILISVQNPFRYGDLIEVDGQMGFVQRVNTRGTLLMTFDGNHIQIPNATIYKNTIKNYTANPNRRFDFVVGIGYDVAVSEAQQAAFDVLANHPAVLQEPEPQVLVEELGSSTVNLRVFAWVDASVHSWMKVRSSIIRLVKREFESAGYSMPDDAREIVFPEAVPVEMIESRPEPAREVESKKSSTSEEQVSNKAEGGFGSEQSELNKQARQSRIDNDDGADLLAETDADQTN